MADTGGVLVQVIEAEPGQEITWGADAVERLADRVDDVRDAIASAFATVSAGLTDLEAPSDWEIGTISATFGVTLSAETGVIVSKASLGATLDVTITFRKSRPLNGQT